MKCLVFSSLYERVDSWRWNSNIPHLNWSNNEVLVASTITSSLLSDRLSNQKLQGVRDIYLGTFYSSVFSESVLCSRKE